MFDLVKIFFRYKLWRTVGLGMFCTWLGLVWLILSACIYFIYTGEYRVAASKFSNAFIIFFPPFVVMLKSTAMFRNKHLDGENKEWGREGANAEKKLIDNFE